MIYTIVKAKSGLHAGATWRLDKSLLTMGASSKADVFLCDPEVPDVLLALRKMGRRVRIDTLHADARLKSADDREINEVLFPSQVISLDYRHIQLEIQIHSASHSLAAAFGDSFGTFFYGIVAALRSLGAKAFVALLFLIGFIMTVMIVFFGTAGVVKSEAKVNPVQPIPRTILRDPPPVALLEKHMVNSVDRELREFARRSGSVNFKVDVDGDTVTVDAQLNRIQGQEFERELIRLGRDYGNYVSLVARMDFTEEQKLVDGIEIERMVLGARPSIILRDGMRLYPGGVFNGLTVVSIDSQKVVLKGSHTYEVVL
ncbi:hypothetical protein [Limnobacter sp.]|uniref:hypothetical protein n=1 Tax=Limnobacter sp. TaxID=2003368 RepID=UPI00351144BF